MTGRRRVIVQRFGGPEVMRVRQDEIPMPGPGQARVRVLAAGVARADLLMRAGRYPGRAPRPPFVPGWDVTGEVEALGEGAPAHLLHQRITALVLSGGYASHVCLPADALILLPEGVDPYRAACLPLNYVTAWELLHVMGKRRDGETVLVLGAAGGVGLALLDLLGSAAYGSAGGGDRVLVESYGANFVDRDTDPVPRADIVLDPLGTGAPGGRLVTYGFLASRPLPTLLRTAMNPHATFYRLSTATRRNPTRVRGALAHLVTELDTGRLKPLIAACIPLENAAEAHRIAHAGRPRGKALLVPFPPPRP